MFYLERKHADEMVAHARAEDPLECCGLLAGRDGKIVKLYPTTNTAASGERYLMDPKELFSIFKELDDNGWEVLAIYHSHTHTEAYPSPTDVQLAYWSEPLYLIVSLKDKANPQIRAFHIREGKIKEEPLALPPPPATPKY